MEENLDLTKESNRNEHDPLKKMDINDMDSSIEKSTLINKNPHDSNNDVIGL